MRALLVSVLLLAGLAPLAPAGAATFQVTAVNFAWAPQSITIDVDDSVEFLDGDGFHNWQKADGSETHALPYTRTYTSEGSFPYRCGFHPGMTGVVNVGTLPTVAIGAPSSGATVSGTFTVSGTASHATSSIASVTVRLANGAPVTATLSGGPTSVTWTAAVPSTSAANGVQTLAATATTSGGLAATASITVQVSNAVFADIALTRATAQPSATTTNIVSFIVRNEGNGPSGAFDVLAEYLYKGTWRPIGTRTVSSMPVGANVGGNIMWTPSAPHVGSFTVRVTADPANALNDVDRADNARTTTGGWFTPLVPGVITTDP